MTWPKQVDPDAFVRWTYARPLAHRQPRYAAMARWGVTVTAEEVAQVRDPADFDALIAAALDRKREPPPNYRLSRRIPSCPSPCPPPCPPLTSCGTKASWSCRPNAPRMQDIRPLRIALLNLMPKKIQTENQFARLIGATPLQIDFQLIRMTEHQTKNTAAEHMETFYHPFAEVRPRATSSTA